MTGHQGKGNRKRWSHADNLQLMAMKKAGKSHDEIADHFSTPTLIMSAHAITAKWSNLNRAPVASHLPKAKTDGLQGIYHRSGEIWSETENIDLRARVASEQSWRDIGLALERAPWACRQQHYELRVLAGEIAPEQITRRASQKTAREARDVKRVEAKALRGIDRDPIRELLGDPLPGRSALDRIKAGIEPEPAWMDGRALRYQPQITLPTLPWQS